MKNTPILKLCFFSIILIIAFCVFFNILTLGGTKQKTWIDIVGIPFGLSMLVLGWLFLGVLTYLKKEDGVYYIFTRFMSDVYGDRRLFSIEKLLLVDLLSFLVFLIVFLIIFKFNFLYILPFSEMVFYSFITSLVLVCFFNLCIFVDYNKVNKK